MEFWSHLHGCRPLASHLVRLCFCRNLCRAFLDRAQHHHSAEDAALDPTKRIAKVVAERSTMKRLRHWLFNFAAALSLFGCLAAVACWFAGASGYAIFRVSHATANPAKRWF